MINAISRKHALDDVHSNSLRMIGDFTYYNIKELKQIED